MGEALEPVARLEGRKEALLEALRAGNTRTAAAGVAGVHRDTFYEWLKNPTFSDRVTVAESEAECRNVVSIERCAQGGTVIHRRMTTKPNGTTVHEEWLLPPDWRAAAWWLERRRRLWGAMPVVDLGKLSHEQIVRLLADEAERGGEDEELPDPGETDERAPAL